MKLLKIAALALAGCSSAALAAEYETEPTASLYISKSFGGSTAKTESINYGLAFSYAEIDSQTQTYNHSQRPAFIDLRFSSASFDSVYLNGLNVIETHKMGQAASGTRDEGWWAGGTAVAANARTDRRQGGGGDRVSCEFWGEGTGCFGREK